MVKVFGGIVLCGGRSVRMGQPKEWMPVGEETLLQRTVRIVGEVCDVTLVVSRRGQAPPPLPVGVEVVHDRLNDAGPLAGIEAGLRALQDRCATALVTACDHPRLQSAVLSELLSKVRDDPAAVIAHEGRKIPLLGVYSTAMADRAWAFLERGERAAHRFADECQAIVITSETFREVDPRLESFFNVNDPAEFERTVNSPTDRP